MFKVGLLVLGILMAQPPLTTETLADQFQVYDDSVGVVARLATEKDIPFRSRGRTVSHELVSRNYKTSVSRFPSVHSCLTGENRNASQPDLSKIDWSLIQSTYDADVCLFRIASSYKSVTSFEKWLQRNGFPEVTRFERNSVGSSGDGIALSASRNIKRDGVLFGHSPIRSFFISKTAYGLSVSIVYDSQGNLFSVGSNYNYL